MWIPDTPPPTQSGENFAVNKGKKRAKMHKKPQKNTLFPYFYKSVDFAQTPPQCGKNTHFLFFFFKGFPKVGVQKEDNIVQPW